MEANILNPTVASPLNPDYGYQQSDEPSLLVFRGRSGPRYSRRIAEAGRTYQLQWQRRNLDNMLLLKQWEHQYEQDFFTYSDYEESRYFSGYFTGPLIYSPAGFNLWDIKGTFQEEPGRAMYAYPANWARDAAFLEERDSAANPNVKLTGTWAFVASAEHHGGGTYYSHTPGDYAEFLYFGYGFQLWCATGPNYGKVQVFIDGVGNGTYDLYHAATVVNAQAIVGFPSVALGLHRIKLVVDATKNAGSSDYVVTADALLVMR
jgi:hypothetical protein